MRSEAGRTLIPIARSAIAAKLGKSHPADEEAPWLREPGASFVMLTHAEKLRGCFGTLRPHRTLLEDVKGNAITAAFHDPRFSPLSEAEFDALEVEISLPSALETLDFADEHHALAQLRVGLDGVLFEYGQHMSTFLPRIWDRFPEPSEFMARLKEKAGLSRDFWDRDVKLSRYTVIRWGEIDAQSGRSAAR